MKRAGLVCVDFSIMVPSEPLVAFGRTAAVVVLGFVSAEDDVTRWKFFMSTRSTLKTEHWSKRGG